MRTSHRSLSPLHRTVPSHRYVSPFHRTVTSLRAQVDRFLSFAAFDLTREERMQKIANSQNASYLAASRAASMESLTSPRAQQTLFSSLERSSKKAPP